LIWVNAWEKRLFMDILKAIQDIALFQGVAAEELKAMLRHASYKKIKQGETVINEQDPIRAFYVIIYGRLRLYKSSPEGKEQTLYLLGPGEPFGLSTAFATAFFPLSVVALEESAVLIIPGTVMERLAGRETALLLNIIRLLSIRLRESIALVEALALKGLPQRLASFLMHLLDKEQVKKDALELAITQRELAKILGVTPEALSRVLRKMNNDGILKVAGRAISILNEKALKTLADGD